MATITELEAKIKKAKSNKYMPDNLKAKYIEKIEKEIAALTLKTGTKKDVEKFLEVPKGKKAKVVKVTPIELPEWSGEDWEGEVYDELEDLGEMDRSDAQGVVDANKSIMDSMYKKKASAKDTAKKILGIEEKEIVKSETKKSDKKSTDYDCDEIIAEAKARKAKQKASSKKANNTPVVKKDEKRVESVVKSIKKHYKEGELTKAQIEALIKELTEKIEELKALLGGKKMAKGGNVEHDKLTKSRIKANLYKPTGDFFIEDKGDNFILHFTPSDALKNNSNLTRMNAKSVGKGYHGSAYSVNKKIED